MGATQDHIKELNEEGGKAKTKAALILAKLRCYSSNRQPHPGTAIMK